MAKLEFLLMLIMTSTIQASVRFPAPIVTAQLCSDVTIGTVVDTNKAIDGTPPLRYSLTSNSSAFQIDKGTGIITVDRALTGNNVTDLVLCKHVADKHGGHAKMLIDITINQPVITLKACPKIQELHVREIAPVGEEVGIVECISNIPDTSLHGVEPLSVSSRGVSSGNVPINITSRGVVLVSQPLVYRNNIHDINIVNVTMLYLRDGGEPALNCNRTETKVTLKVIVDKSDCVSNWTYEMKKYFYLEVEPILRMPVSEPEDCMSVCTFNDTLLCHGFNYNVMRDECLFLNETEYTLANATKRRLGMLLYRKYCKTEPLPIAAIRNTNIQVANVTSVNISACADILGKLFTGMCGTVNISSRDLVLASDVFSSVVDKLNTGNASRQELEKLLRICGQLFDFLILKANDTVSNKKVKMFQLLTAFDSLLEMLSNNIHNDWTMLNIRSQQTTFHIQRVPKRAGNQTSAMSLFPGRSGVRLKVSSENETYINNSFTNIISGSLDGLGHIVTPILVAQTGDDASGGKMIIQGQIVSVVMYPYPSDPLEIQLDISTEIGSNKQSPDQRMCAFLQRNTQRQSIWDKSGCWLVKYNTTHTSCRCSHLTNFAILMQVTQFHLDGVHVTSLEILTVIGCCVSIAALSTTVAVLLWFRLRSERYILLLHLSVAVALAQIVFLTGIDAVQNRSICRMVAILLHYLYLCVFTLMLAEGIHLFHKLHRAFDADDNLNMLLLLGWGSPFVIVSLSLLTDGDGYSTEMNCWLSTEGAIWAFVGPALTIIAINFSVLVMIIRTFLGVAIVAKKTEVQKFKASLKATAVLLPLLGITWMFGVVAVNNNTVVFQYIFALLNSLQGLFIFLFHVVFNEDVKKACSVFKRNQVTSSDNLPKTIATSVRRMPKKANIYTSSSPL